MSFDVSTSPVFDRQAKRLVKKYPSLKGEIATLARQLAENPLELGTPLGYDCYKIRLAIASKNTGKSGGARVIYLVVTRQESEQEYNGRVTLLTIYDKAEQDNVSDKVLLALVRAVEE